MDIIEVNPETGAISPRNPIKIFLERSGKILFSPAQFFREDYTHMDISDSATFGLVCAWIANIVAFLWQTVNSLVLAGLFERWVQRLLSSDESFLLLAISGETFLWSAGLLLLLPVLLLLRTALSTMAIFIFAKLLISDERSAPDQVTFQNIFRIQSASLAAKWFLVVPFFGGLLASIAFLIFNVTAIRERFAISTRRSVAVVLAPYLVLFFLFLLFLLIGFYAFTQLPFEEILEQMQSGEDFSF